MIEGTLATLVGGAVGIAIAIILLLAMAAAGERGWIPVYPSAEAASAAARRSPWDRPSGRWWITGAATLPQATIRSSRVSPPSPSAGGEGIGP
ncbi:hypothetical protein EDC65_2229 [Stella humosa]|uniref:Uncharacterized protein n=1 Tax=Stella humosa TaxID=94 RepID=A0A3N1MCF3_9PROT|nr:hypothetical protein [Stella humosa]ROQ00430.1 hypothetical protein EDC65_2229 [Stella humosa]BBK30326.1 hypothetical protein STHU_09600 [Stella humosa]